ncbi:Uncharacterised protein [Ectopseudomonas mendocina]|uniref:Uncharacterized protein n=1 Tax=Ectopseudomonas mendocina TaxID=300 RepID=A0A379PLL9_ECTME|nr:hypothetical protein [Pseudomonas mendocina]SUE95861.1 Uncharacterised protein [Pseudomonas mendocina]
MSKINQVLIGISITLFICYQIVALVGKAYMEFGEQSIDQVEGEGVRCYLYREALSCIQNDESETEKTQISPPKIF